MVIECRSWVSATIQLCIILLEGGDVHDVGSHLLFLRKLTQLASEICRGHDNVVGTMRQSSAHLEV